MFGKSKSKSKSICLLKVYSLSKNPKTSNIYEIFERCKKDNFYTFNKKECKCFNKCIKPLIDPYLHI